jgi:hypothetical protein
MKKIGSKKSRDAVPLILCCTWREQAKGVHSMPAPNVASKKWPSMPHSHNGTPEQTVLRSMCRVWTLWNIPMGLKRLYRRGHYMRECIVMASFIIIPLNTLHTLCTVGSSDFPISLCFMEFWFGLEIRRLVYKKAF